MEKMKKYSMYLVKCAFASAIGLAAGYLIANPLAGWILETNSLFMVRIIGFAATIIIVLTVGIIENRKRISSLHDVRNNLGKIVNSGITPSIFTALALSVRIIRLISTESPQLPTIDYLLIVTGLVGIFAEGWFIACIILLPFIILNPFTEPETLH